MDETYQKIESILSRMFGKEGASLLVDDLRIAIESQNRSHSLTSKVMKKK